MRRASRLFMTLTLTSALAWAEQPPGGPQGGPPKRPDPERFQQHKAQALEHIQKRVQILQQLQSCVQGATSREQMKACHDQERAAHEQMRQQKGPGRGK